MSEAFRRFLGCGVLSRGFVRVRCQCGEESLVAFSCKGEPWRAPFQWKGRCGFCPSCTAPLMVRLSNHVAPRRRLTWSTTCCPMCCCGSSAVAFNLFGNRGGPRVSAHGALAQPDLVSRQLAHDDGLGFGATAGWDLRPIADLSLRAGVGAAWTSARWKDGASRLPLVLEIGIGPVFQAKPSKAPQKRDAPAVRAYDGFDLQAATAFDAQERVAVERFCREVYLEALEGGCAGRSRSTA